MLTQELINEISKLGSREDAKEAYSLIKERLRQLDFQATKGYRIGDIVSFTGRYGKQLQGKIRSIGPKNIKVAIGNPPIEVWNVPATLLTPVIESLPTITPEELHEKLYDILGE